MKVVVVIALCSVAAVSARTLAQLPPPQQPAQALPSGPQQLQETPARSRYDPLFNPIIAVNAAKANAFAGKVPVSEQQQGATQQGFAQATPYAAVQNTTDSSTLQPSGMHRPGAAPSPTSDTVAGVVANPAGGFTTIPVGAPAAAVLVPSGSSAATPVAGLSPRWAVGTGALQAGSGSFSNAFAPQPISATLAPSGAFPGLSNSLAGSQTQLGSLGASTTQEGLSGTSTQQPDTAITATATSAAPAPLTPGEFAVADAQSRSKTFPQFQTTPDGVQVNQPVLSNPDGVTSGGNTFKAGTGGVTFGNAGTGGSIQFARGGGITVDPGKAGSLWALAKQAAALYG